MLKIILGIVGCLGYLYWMWRKLRENYKEEDMIAFGWVSLLAYLIGSRVAANPGRWFEFWKMGESNPLGGYGLWLLLGWLVSSDRGWKFFAFGEDNVGLLLWLNGLFLVLAGRWLPVLWLLVVGLVAKWMARKYRSWGWYKSGRKGFVFLMVNILVFGGLALIYRNLFFLIPSLICGGGLVMLGGGRYS